MHELDSIEILFVKSEKFFFQVEVEKDLMKVCLVT
jgi:hypothetical protein